MTMTKAEQRLPVSPPFLFQMADIAKRNQIVQIVAGGVIGAAKSVERQDVVNVEFPTRLFRRLAAMLADQIAFPGRPLGWFPRRPVIRLVAAGPTGVTFCLPSRTISNRSALCRAIPAAAGVGRLDAERPAADPTIRHRIDVAWARSFLACRGMGHSPYVQALPFTKASLAAEPAGLAGDAPERLATDLAGGNVGSSRPVIGLEISNISFSGACLRAILTDSPHRIGKGFSAGRAGAFLPYGGFGRKTARPAAIHPRSIAGVVRDSRLAVETFAYEHCKWDYIPCAGYWPDSARIGRL